MDNNENNKGTGNNTFFDRLEKDFAERNDPIGEGASEGETLNRNGSENRPNQSNRFRQNNNSYGDSNNPSNPNNFGRNRMNFGRQNQNSDDDDNSPTDELKDRIKDEASRKIRDEATKKIKEKATEQAGKEVAKEAGKEVAKQAGKEVAKQAGKEVAKQAGKEVVKKTVETAVVEGGGSALFNPYVLAAIGIILVVLIIIVGVMAVAIYKNSLTDIKMENGYALFNGAMCEHVTVTNSDYAGTYPFEQYVAGVVAGEVGFFGNDTVNKALAIAARGYFVTHNKDCAIAGNATKQVYKPPTAATTAAARATEGLIVIKGGSALSTEYDAFAYKSEDNNNYYLHQQNQAIPKSWANQKGITKSLETYKNAYHGRGMSQWGALYLAESGKTFEEILKYYYGNDITIAKAASILNFNPNVKDTNTPASNILREPLATFLPNHGSSINAVNQTIFNAVNEAGYGTANGVAAAAYSLITIMDQNFGVRLPYAHGGHAVYANSPTQQNYTAPLGIDGAWGTYGNYYWNGTTLHYYGMDCNAFMQWAMYNGGMPFKHVYTDPGSMAKEYGVATCNASSADCKGVPGDLLVNGGHVMMIVGATDTTYTIAHSSSPQKGMFIYTQSKKVSGYNLVKMGSYYSTHRR